MYGGWGKQSVHVNELAVVTGLFFSLGKTNIFGEYRHDDAGSNPGKTVGASINFWQADHPEHRGG